MTTRNQQLQHWIQKKISIDKFIALKHCASFRRYFRVTSNNNCFIAVDAPPEQESCDAFVQQTNYLTQHNINVPKLIAYEQQQGFLLLEDFGDQRLDQILQPSNAQALYKLTLDELTKINQLTPKPVGRYHALDTSLIHEEMNGFKEWYLHTLCNKKTTSTQQQELHTIEHLLQKNSAEQPQVFVHRDYQSQNIMLLNKREIGILDYQDAMIGPVTYDIASLLRDCYQHWPSQLITECALYYKNKMPLTHIDNDTFLRWFDFTSTQRLLKCLFTFARKSARDQDDNYLQYIPNTIAYITQISQGYDELKPLVGILT